MDREDGQIFIKHLANFVRTHEKALANAIQAKNNRSNAPTPTSGLTSPVSPYPPSSSSSSLSTLSSYLSFGSRNTKPVKLTMTAHHLFYLLSRFSELSIVVGPMDIRLENIHTNASPANYVSFLNETQRKNLRSSDRDSIHSVSSIRSVMSSMSSIWTTLGLADRSEAKIAKQKAAIKEDLTYLYSAFTKVPCLRLAPDHRAPLIAGYEEFPFDTAVPLFAFKNVSVLEITDMDFRQFCGWDRLADQLRSLTIKRGNVDDPADLLINIVLDDMEKRRKRSAKQSNSPAIPLATPSPAPRQGDFASPQSTPDSPPPVLERPASGSLSSYPLGIHSGSYSGRPRSTSPSRATLSRHGSARGHSRSGTPKLRRSSGSSISSGRTNTPRGSTANLLSFGILPPMKWRFLGHLSLAENGLTSISAAGLAPLANTLQSLDLSSNLLAEIPDILSSLVALRSLNLANNMIESLHSLGRNPLPAITALNLRANRLSSLAGIHRLLSLERLDLRENKLNDPTEIARLTGIPNMSDIYVCKNPFVKGYTNYRITIFNLFRRTPGYIEDLFLDGTQPSYSERKLLVDRAPELPNVLVVKPPPEEERVSIPMPVLPRLDTRPDATPLQDPFQERRRSQDLMRPRRPSDYASQSQRRRKGTRRRVVELSENDFATERRISSVDSIMPTLEDVTPPPVAKAALTDDSTYGGSEVESTPVRARTSVDIPTVQHLLPTRDSMSPPMLRTGSEPLPSATPRFDVESDVYRQRIDALRSDFGNGWLSALSDDNWDAQLSPPTSMGPPTAPVRQVSQGIVSGTRTLG
ncbi:hypothetical protein EJ08DRAFT_248072 [Tothia fuscella]|uniref:Leucine-rich repeat-containing protein n=1 Tax=Tothia fuscella TaxID=1048955 RepID=A0A9P4NRW9_9PEZI|nr:hypothetical protein EJ08DRAFT_248072 [Tothia fuscella]